jgi:hypothetical protein
LSGIAIHQTNPNIAWVTFSGFDPATKVFYTNNGGTTWINVSGSLPNVPVNCIEYQNGSNDLVYIGTDLGVFYMDATMNDWAPYNTNLPNAIINELEIHYPTNTLRAATFGRGIWQSPLQSSVVQSLDASAMTMAYPGNLTCNTTFAPVVRIRNSGSNTLTSVNLHYKLDAQPWQIYSWSGTLSTLATDDITLPTYTFTVGSHTLRAYTSAPNGGTDLNNINDTTNGSFTVMVAAPGNAPPVTQGFVSTTFPPPGWTAENSSSLWSRVGTFGGFGTSTQCAMAAFYSTASGTDHLETPAVNFSNVMPPIRLYFDLAYAEYSSLYKDSLIVELYTDCPGVSQRIYAKGGPTLSTTAPSTSSFTPNNSQWRTDTINLDTLAGKTARSIRFVAKTGYGNNLYLDNVNLTGLNGSTGVVQTLTDAVLEVFPNPAGNTLNIGLTQLSVPLVTVQLFDVTGREVARQDDWLTGKGLIRLDVSSVSEGIYLLRVRNGEREQLRKITVAH